MKNVITGVCRTKYNNLIKGEVNEMNEPILRVDNMTKRFGSTVALDQVSLTVYPGEIRGLIGENGSGKSTVTSIVAGMQKCDEGSMTFKGGGSYGVNR